MIDIYMDAETTGVNPYRDEPIEIYFRAYKDGEFYDDYYFKSKVDVWSYEAELIHGISQLKAQNYPNKDTAFRQLLDWLPSRFKFITYTNKKTMQGTINFDVAILENELHLQGFEPYYLKNEYKMSDPISVHDLAKECAKKGYYQPIKNNGRASFTQENVYGALFGQTYDAHNAVDDVIALVRIHDKLLSFEGETLPLFRQY
jgi:DNA polymerase III epsilon subunit-like protein